MSTKPGLQQACNTQSCEQIFGCSQSGCYGSDNYHGVYYNKVTPCIRSDWDDGVEYCLEYGPSYGRLEYLVFQGAHIVWGDSKINAVSANVSCYGVSQAGKTWGNFDCSPCSAEIGPFNIGGWLYTAYGCCGGYCWHNGTEWKHYGWMNVKRKPA